MPGESHASGRLSHVDPREVGILGPWAEMNVRRFVPRSPGLGAVTVAGASSLLRMKDLIYGDRFSNMLGVSCLGLRAEPSRRRILVKRLSRAIVCVLMGASSGCAVATKEPIDDQFDKKDPLLRAVFACTAGLVSGAKGEAALQGDMKKAAAEGKVDLSVRASVDDWIRGYILEVLPPEDRLKGFELYQSCMRNPPDPGAAEVHPSLESLRAKSTKLYTNWEEAKKLGSPLGVADSDRYALTGKALKDLDYSVLDAKNRYIALDRAALMYFLAGEILLAPENALERKQFDDRLLDYSDNSLDLATRAEHELSSILAGELNDETVEWLNRSEARAITLDRLAECQAQAIFVGRDDLRDDLDITLGQIPCDYIRRYKIAGNVVYQRIAAPRRFLQCSGATLGAIVPIYDERVAGE